MIGHMPEPKYGPCEELGGKCKTRDPHDSNNWVKPGPTSIREGLDIGNVEAWAVEDFPVGMVGPAGNADAYYTGAWRAEKPLWDSEKCTNCMLCWINCADTAVLMSNQQVGGINYNHCKGCGVCPLECRSAALVMVPEHVDHLAPVKSAENVEVEPEITQGA